MKRRPKLRVGQWIKTEYDDVDSKGFYRFQIKAIEKRLLGGYRYSDGTKWAGGLSWWEEEEVIPIPEPSARVVARLAREQAKYQEDCIRSFAAALKTKWGLR